jgi:hypothetical protein
MPLLEIDQHPSLARLRWHGLIQSLGITLIGAVCYWRFQTPAIAWTLWGIAGLFFAVYYAVPFARRPLYLTGVYATYPLAVLLSLFTLLVIYVGIFTVFGSLLKLSGYDPLRRKFSRQASTYWTQHEGSRPASRYFRQF